MCTVLFGVCVSQVAALLPLGRDDASRESLCLRTLVVCLSRKGVAFETPD